MVWTLPSMTLDKLHTTDKYHNHGTPCNISKIVRELGEAHDTNYQNAFELPAPIFVQTMWNEMRDMIEEIHHKKPDDRLEDIFIKNNRLLYIGFLVVFFSILVWLIVP